MARSQDIFGLLNKLQSSHISVVQDRCAVVRNRNAQCMRCAQVCTSGCISLEDDQLVIAAEKCIGCGTCATICPTCALEAHHPDDSNLFMECVQVMERTEGIVTLACQNRIDQAGDLIDREKVVPLTCMGRVEESLLIMLASLGCKQVVLVAEGCGQCEHHHGFDAATQVVQTANKLLQAWHSPTIVKLGAKFPSCTRRQKQGYDPNKRAFFHDAAKGAKSVSHIAQDYAVEQAAERIAPTPEPAPARYTRVMADGTLPHFIPGRRGRLIEGLQALGQPDNVLIDTRLWGHVNIDETLCDSCQRCATFCPTGAIAKFTEADGTFGIDHYPSRCVKCRCCEDICHTNALTLSDQVFIRDIMDGTRERHTMAPLEFEPGNLRQMHERIGKLIGVEEVYDH